MIKFIRKFLEPFKHILFISNIIEKINFRINNLEKFYNRADLYINSSHCEGFSSSIVEAMNYNIPVICSDSKGGNREIVAHGKAGYLFKVDDVNDLKDKITLLLNKKKKL